jgi:type I restriction enzyme M protein
MPVKKSELYSSIWKSCDELRGGMNWCTYWRESMTSASRR